MSCTCFSTASTFCSNCSIVPARFSGLISGCISSFGYSRLYIRPRSTWFANSSISGAKGKYDCINCFICLSAFRKILEPSISPSNSSNFFCVVDFLWFRTRMSASSKEATKMAKKQQKFKAVNR